MTLDDWQREGHAFTYRGERLFYRRAGRGDRLVLLHGFPTASWDWHRLWPNLVARFDVIALDMIGFGFSAKPPGYPYSLLDQADAHEALLAELGVTEGHLLAHDYGDSVAQELLARHAETSAPTRRLTVRSACLLNGGIFPGIHRPLAVQRWLMSPVGAVLARVLSRRTLRRSFDRIFGEKTRPSETELDDFWTLIEHNGGRRVFHRLIRYMREREIHRDRWVGALTECPVPLRLVNGGMDPISGAHVAEHFRRTVPNPDVVELDGIGHYPQIEAPQQVLDAFLEFVEPHRG